MRNRLAIVLVGCCATAAPMIAQAQQCAVPDGAIKAVGAPTQTSPPQQTQKPPSQPGVQAAVIPPNPTPDTGYPAVASAVVEASPALKNVAKSGAKLYDMGVSGGGIRHIFATVPGSFAILHVSPDGTEVIKGVAYDGEGNDLSVAQVRNIPGVVPSATIGSTLPPGPAFDLVQKAHGGLLGSEDAPELYMFVDPQCSYSQRAMAELKSLVDQGRVRVAIIPVSILDHEDRGLSTINATKLLSVPSAAMVDDWMHGHLPDTIEPTAPLALSENEIIRQRAGVKGTPTFFWKKADGSVGRQDGMPSSIPALVTSIGS